MKDDTISRAAALTALGEEPPVWHEDDAGEVAERNQWRRDVAAIKALPSAQLAQDLPKGCTDMISRADAIKAICEDGTRLERQGKYSITMAERKQRDADILEALPSATDTNVATTDTISRQAAIKSIQECADAAHSNYEWDREEGYLNSIDCIKALPSAQPDFDAYCDRLYKAAYERGKKDAQPGWIPCKTRKPEKSGLYLVTKQQKTGEIQLATAHYNTAFDEWSGNGNFKKVLAWMPLPTPYREGQSG